MIFISLLNDDYSRSAVYLEFLRKTNKATYLKAPNKGIKLFRFALTLNRQSDDVVVIMSPSHKLVITVWLLTKKKKIILDAGWSLTEANLSRVKNNLKFLKLAKCYLVDFFSFHLSDLIMAESNSQKNYLARNFKIREKKLSVLFSGFNEIIFESINAKKPMETKNKNLENKKILFFRGKYNEEAGIEDIIEVINDLKYEKIHLIVATQSEFLKKFDSELVTVIPRYLENSEIKYLYEFSDLTFGQMGKNSRIKNTIAHKFYESLYFGVPIICQDTAPHREIFGDWEYPLYIKNDVKKELKQLITKYVSSDFNLLEIRKAIGEIYSTKLSQKVLSEEFQRIII